MTTNKKQSYCEGQGQIEKARDAAQEKRASGPSPEAKQAAEPLPCPFCGEECQIIRETATAYYVATCVRCDQSGKTKEEAITEWNKRSDTATAKALEELEQQKQAVELAIRDRAIARRNTALDVANALIRELQGQLAHQQPSGKPKHPMQTATNCGRCQDTKRVNGKPCPDCQQPSAPTADMEKIARDCCHDIENRTDDCDIIMHAKVMRALAQARAPLVADKERLDWLAQNIIDGVASIKVDKAFTHQGNLPELLREAIDAALTGTGAGADRGPKSG